MFSEWWAVILLRHHTLMCFFFFCWTKLAVMQSSSSHSASRLRQPLQVGEGARFLAWRIRGRACHPGEGGQPRESLREGERLKSTEGGKGREPHTRRECTPTLAATRPHLSLAQRGHQFYSGVGVTGILNVWIPTVPALLMAGRAPFSAHNRFPPKGTYCWDEGRLSVFRSCLLCLSRRMECTAFRKSFRLSGELWKEDLHVLGKQHLTHGELLMLSGTVKQISLRTKVKDGRLPLQFHCWGAFSSLEIKNTYSFPFMLCDSSPAANLGQSAPLLNRLMERWILRTELPDSALST